MPSPRSYCFLLTLCSVINHERPPTQERAGGRFSPAPHGVDRRGLLAGLRSTLGDGDQRLSRPRSRPISILVPSDEDHARAAGQKSLTAPLPGVNVGCPGGRDRRAAAMFATLTRRPLSAPFTIRPSSGTATRSRGSVSVRYITRVIRRLRSKSSRSRRRIYLRYVNLAPLYHAGNE